MEYCFPDGDTKDAVISISSGLKGFTNSAFISARSSFTSARLSFRFAKIKEERLSSKAES